MPKFSKYKFLLYTLKTHMPFIFIFLGAFLEVCAVTMHFVVPYPLLNALVGLASALLLWYGAYCLLGVFGVRRRAGIFVMISGAALLTFKILDVYFTLNYPRFSALLGIDFDLEQMAVNLAIVLSGICMLLGILFSINDAHAARVQLAKHNVQLAHEILERQQSEQRAQASENRLNVLLNALSASVFLVDEHGILLAYNHHFASLFGLEDHDLTGRHIAESMPEELCNTGKVHALKVLECGLHKSFACTYQDRTFEVGMYPVLGEQEHVSQIAVLARDVTEQILREQELLLLETAISHTAESILITDAEGRIQYVNPAFETLTGYSRQEACGRTPALLQSGRHDASFYRSLWMTLRNGFIWKGSFINRKKGGELFSESATISPIKNSNGDITHYIGVKRDVTREQQLEQQLHQAQKIEAIGALAGGIAHDINNVFAIVLGHSELAREKLGEEHPACKHLSTISRTAQRSSQLIKRLLIFSRKKNEDAEVIDFPAFVEEQKKMVRAYLPSNIVITGDIAPEAGFVLAAPGEVQQIIFNLCTNSSQAMQPAGGMLEISVHSVCLQAPTMLRTGEAPPGTYLRMRIRDTGSGMESETLKQIFDPFFTTKSLEQGTGLGLATVHDTMTRLGGYVDVSSQYGQGSCFDVYWPAQKYIPASPLEPVTACSGNGHTLLLVEDMQDFKELTESILTGHGFRLVSFTEPNEAVAYLEKHPHDINAALVDYMMPGMNGIQLARELHLIRPDLPIALLSGYASGVDEDNARDYGFQIMLRKPTPADMLISTMSALVNQTPEQIPPC